MRERMRPHGDAYPAPAREWTGRTPSRTSITDAQPLVVRYAEEHEHTYLVHDFDSGDTVAVPKRRAADDLHPSRTGRRPPGTALLRWSKYALVGVVFGGAPGIVLGALIVFVSFVRLASFGVRARHWLHREEAAPLPAIAATERLYLVAAFGQGVLAILLGGMVLALLLGRLL